MSRSAWRIRNHSSGPLSLVQLVEVAVLCHLVNAFLQHLTMYSRVVDDLTPHIRSWQIGRKESTHISTQ